MHNSMPVVKDVNIHSDFMRKYTLFAALTSLIAFHSCGDIGKDTGNAIGKGGEIVGKSAGEFFSGVGQGVESATDCKIILSDELKAAGLSTGTYTVEDSGNGTHNAFVLYLIYEKDFSGKIQAKVSDAVGAEKGRISREITAKAGNTAYVDFVFDPRTRIENKNTIELSLQK